MAYTPAAMTTASPTLPYLIQTFYKRKALDRLMKKFVFREPCEKDSIPKANGRTCQWYRYNNLGTMTTPGTEGSVGSPQTISNRILQATVSQYTSFINLSDFLIDTAPDDTAQNAAELLGYQAGLTVDTLTRTIHDDAAASTNQNLLSTYARVADLRNARHQLQAVDVQPMDDGYFYGYAHPFVTFDIVNDPAAGGLADIYKYTSSDKGAGMKYEDRGLIAMIGGVRLKETTNVYTSANPNKYRMYIYGKGAVACVDLAGRGPSDVKDPAKQSFKINVIKGAPSIVDPEGVIGAAVSYNFVYTGVILEGPSGIGGTYRYKTLDCQSSIG